MSDGTTTDSATQVITVFAKPVIDFSADRTTGCPNDSIHFTAISAGDAPISQYAWGFGNGRGNNSFATSYQYGQAGIYDVTLVVLDTNGCTANATKPAYIRIWPAPTASFTLTPAVTCGTSQIVSFTNSSQDTGLTYLWIFGDSTVSTQRDTSHLYTYGKYSPKLMVTNTNGCTSMISHDIIVINLHAAFTADKVEACAGEQISFTNMSPMPGGSWHWDFGDLTTSARQNPMHVYTQPGTYHGELFGHRWGFVVTRRPE